MPDSARIEQLFSVMHDCIEQMEDKLEFYRKFLDSPSPKHRGIPFMAASEGFGSSNYDPYGRFRDSYKVLVQEMGLGHLWDQARQRGGWAALIGKAKRILYPDVPMFVPTPERPKAPKVKHDSERARLAEPYLSSAIEEMKRSVQDLEQTYNNDPKTFMPGTDTEDEIDQFLERKSIKIRSQLWRSF